MPLHRSFVSLVFSPIVGLPLVVASESNPFGWRTLLQVGDDLSSVASSLEDDEEDDSVMSEQEAAHSRTIAVCCV